MIACWRLFLWHLNGSLALYVQPLHAHMPTPQWQLQHIRLRQTPHNRHHEHLAAAQALSHLKVAALLALALPNFQHIF